MNGDGGGEGGTQMEREEKKWKPKKREEGKPGKERAPQHRSRVHWVAQMLRLMLSPLPPLLPPTDGKGQNENLETP